MHVYLICDIAWIITVLTLGSELNHFCHHVYVPPDSSLCQNGKQVEIITKMIFELCYIEAHG